MNRACPRPSHLSVQLQVAWHVDGQRQVNACVKALPDTLAARHHLVAARRLQRSAHAIASSMEFIDFDQRVRLAGCVASCFGLTVLCRFLRSS